MTQTERKYRENLRQLRRLQLKLSSGTLKRAGATEAAIDRRMAADRRLLAQLAAEESRDA